MANGIIRLERGGREWFLEWSTVVDAPVTCGMSEAELRDHVKEEYGNRGLERIEARLERCRRCGHSYLDDESQTVAEFVEYNRAGPGESCLTVDELIDAYCVRREGS